MVSFDSSLPGTAAEAWAADGRLAALPALDIDTSDRAMVIAAHPDDETLGAGGLIAECFLRGIPVTVVIVTDGAASHEASAPDEISALVARREQEARTAVDILAPGSSVTFLGFPDGAVREQRDAIQEALTSLVEQSAGTTTLVAPWRGDGHRDHRVLGEICADVSSAAGLRLVEYPIWMWHWSTPENATTPWENMQALQLRPQSVAAKRRAIAAYESQITAGSAEPGDEAVLHPKFLRHFGRSSETFILGHTPAVEPESAESASLPGAYFDATYARRSDPWGFETRWYENRKRALTLAALPAEHYESVFEIGCSIGVLTEQLAARSASLLSVDISQAAVERARDRLASQAHVTIERSDVGQRYPDRRFDLVVFSEVGYYFDEATLSTVINRIVESLGASGTVVACHWRHPVEDYPLTGDTVHEALRSHSGLARLAVHVEEDFILEVFSPDSRSVASRTGLV
ncbi:MAG TPA: bifunctional PIG-L family deacetylase/class I SAM-dependent methyltransferase [Glaciihabitans sp.]|jgi:LmbE family N-acetylglucosaminyl deacetylase/protein-L-isoaspartate O-methyltransferase|nr:bifunctional PIG-L family deacetylase/class I SAM-dependent methyltransferase [Glaciihabitans sp.]